MATKQAPEEEWIRVGHLARLNRTTTYEINRLRQDNKLDTIGYEFRKTDKGGYEYRKLPPRG